LETGWKSTCRTGPKAPISWPTSLSQQLIRRPKERESYERAAPAHPATDFERHTWTLRENCRSVGVFLGLGKLYPFMKDSVKISKSHINKMIWCIQKCKVPLYKIRLVNPSIALSILSMLLKFVKNPWLGPNKKMILIPEPDFKRLGSMFSLVLI